MDKYKCTVLRYVYDPEEGDLIQGLIKALLLRQFR